MLESLLQFGGRLHPMILHAPIGLIIGLVAVEFLGAARGKPVSREVRLGLAWLAAVSAAASVLTGLLLNSGGGYPSKTAGLHQWVAIAAGAAVVLAAVAAQARAGGVYVFFLLAGAGLLVPAGHLGATMTHGEGFLLEPFRRDQEPRRSEEVADTPVAQGEVTHARSAYARLIVPILEDHCYSCHGARKRKGGLSLHTPQAIVEGGDTGVPITPGDVDGSELIRRLRLPIDDEEHMPPRSKDQLQPEEMKLLEAWIRAGASFESEDDLGAPAESPASPGETVAPPGSARLGPAPADSAALERVRSKLVHAEPVARDSTLLVIDAAAAASTFGDEDVTGLLLPLSNQIADLSLARTKITDRALEVIATFPNLKRLSLAGTAIGDAGISRLAEHPAIEELIVSQTEVTDAGVRDVARAPRLRTLYTWGSGTTADGLRAVRHDHGELFIDSGDFQPAEVLIAEPEVVLKKPGETALASLSPVNATCPVSGKQVDAAFALVHRGKVVGFCCRHCLGQFLEDPSKFESKIN